MAEARELAAIVRQQTGLAASLGVLSEINKLTCNARTRRNGRCRRTDLASNGRCRFHGGASTGPKSDEGKARARLNLQQRWKRRDDQES